MAEKTLGQISRDLRALFAKGNDALLRENFDYAIALFNQILDKEPGAHECRRALRAAQQGKTGGGGGFFKKMLSTAGSSPAVAKAQMALRKDPAEALRLAEHVLNSDPLNSGAHRVVAEAATAMEMPATAALSLDVLAKHSPKDKGLAIQLAQALGKAGEGKRAERILLELSRSMPNDAELTQALKNMSARETLGEGGYAALEGGQGSYRDILKNESEAVALEQEHRVQKDEDVTGRLILEYETRLKSEKDNLRLMRTLAELYTQKNRFEPALALYDQIKASEMGGSDPTLDRAIAETFVRRYTHQIQQLDPSAPDHAAQIARLNAEKLAYQIKECQKRVEHFPTDLAIRFEMGELYFAAGKIGEAMQEFQKSQNNPHKRIPSKNYLAQCFAKRKMFDLAASTLQDALKEKPVFDEEKKELIYNLGCVLESMGKKEEAIEQLKQIYKEDAGYRDVAAKVDAYYAGQ